MKLTMITTRSTLLAERTVSNAGGKGGAPAMPAPVAASPTPTIDNSAEVAKQRALEDQRAKRAKGLAATDTTGGSGVALDSENIDKTEAKDNTTLLGQ